MSSASVTSSKRELHREASTSDMKIELESVRALNSSLRAYLEHIRMFKKNLTAMNDNCKQLSKVNSQWVDVLSIMK